MPVVSIGVLPGVSSSKRIAPEESLGEQPKGTALNQDQVAAEPHVLNGAPAQDSAIERGRAAEASEGKGESVQVGDKVVVVQPQDGCEGHVPCEGAIPDTIESPDSSSRGTAQSESSEGKELEGNSPARGAFHYTVVSSSESSCSSKTGLRDLDTADYTHQLNVAVTPDGKIITGRCLTYEDGRGGTLAKNFFCDKIHYSSANPSYHKREPRRLGLCGHGGCTVT